MWKESYKIGVELVDKQHEALFDMVEHLVKAVGEGGAWEEKKEDCRQAIDFLKNYVVMHFQAEEGYQASIGYAGLEEHKKLHSKFTNDVLEYEQRLLATDFEVKLVKQFVGMLTAWLIYHVADADQKFGQNVIKEEKVKERTVLQCYLKSVADVLNRMVSLDGAALSGTPVPGSEPFGDLTITVGIVGDIQGKIEYGFSKEFAFAMMKLMTFMEMHEIDEMVCSAMSEIANIISGNASALLAQKGYSCDITTPSLTVGTALEVLDLKAKILIQTPFGDLSVATTFAS